MARCIVLANATRVGIGLGQGFARSNVWGIVVSYDITLIDSTLFETFSCKGEILPLGILSIIGRLNPGAKIILSNVYYDLVNDDTVLVSNKRVEDFEYTEITVRPEQNNCSFTGGFLDTTALAIYNSARDNFYVFTGFTGKIKHGLWSYYTGYCPRWLWVQEMYDSGRLVWMKAWDSAGFMYINATKSPNNDSVYIKEIHPNGQTRYEGWVVTDFENYMFRGEFTPNRGDIPSVNPYMEYFRRMKFIPVGEWKAYHTNGQLKYNVSFTTFTGDPHGEYYYIEDESLLPKNNVVVNGIWEVYDENGIKTNTYKYNKGIIQE